MEINCLDEAMDYVSTVLDDRDNAILTKWCDTIKERCCLSTLTVKAILSELFNLKDKDERKYRICKNGHNKYWIQHKRYDGYWYESLGDGRYDSYVDARAALDELINSTKKDNDIQIVYEV